MSKKLVVSLVCVFVVVAVVLILFWTLFALSSVTVSFQSTLSNLSLTEDEIVEAGQFHYGSCVLFDNKKTAIEKINDKAKEDERFAYIRVVNIETVFPNKYVVHVAERERLFAVRNSENVFICDRDFRVLDVKQDFDATSEDCVLLKGLQIENSEISVGDFLQIKQTYMLKFFSAFSQNNRTLREVVGKFSEAILSTYSDDFTGEQYHQIEINSASGQKFLIKNPDFAFANKVALLYSVESALFSQKTDNDNILDSDGNQIFLIKNEHGEFLPYTQGSDEDKVSLTYSLLEKCQIVVDNLTLSDFVDRTEADIFYYLKQI